MPAPSSPPAPLLEIACFNEESALVAAGAGAGRIESVFASNYPS